jgi:hypothetical protein
LTSSSIRSKEIKQPMSWESFERRYRLLVLLKRIVSSLVICQWTHKACSQSTSIVHFHSCSDLSGTWVAVKAGLRHVEYYGVVSLRFRDWPLKVATS